MTQATLGYGDIAPEAAALRSWAASGDLGFALLTVAASRALSIGPVLQRKRAGAGRQLERLSQAIDEVRVDLTRHPSTFYFGPFRRARCHWPPPSPPS